MTTKYNSS